jgi:DNA-directed RNA polymerase subunit RPC12/RpoP
MPEEIIYMIAFLLFLLAYYYLSDHFEKKWAREIKEAQERALTPKPGINLPGEGKNPACAKFEGLARETVELTEKQIKTCVHYEAYFECPHCKTQLELIDIDPEIEHQVECWNCGAEVHVKKSIAD